MWIKFKKAFAIQNRFENKLVVKLLEFSVRNLCSTKKI